MENRLVYIDLVRAYAIFLVTVFHLWRFFGMKHYEFLYYDLFSFMERGWGGVELFFFISGYSMSLVTYNPQGVDNVDWKKYFLKRLFRIIPAYYIAIIIWSFLIANGVAQKPIGLIDQLSHLLFIHTFSQDTYYSISGVFWSLGIEMQFYFILPFILGFIINRPIFSLIIACIPMLYVFFVKEIFLFNKTVFAFVIYFILGYIVFMYKNKLYKLMYNNIYSHQILTIFIFIFVNLSFCKDYVHSGQVHVFLWVISFVPIFIFLYRNEWLKNSNNKFLKLFVFTGTSSYSIYLYNYIFYLHKKPFSYTIESLIFYLFLIYLTGISMYFVVEKPFQKMRKKFL